MTDKDLMEKAKDLCVSSVPHYPEIVCPTCTRITAILLSVRKETREEDARAVCKYCAGDIPVNNLGLHEWNEQMVKSQIPPYYCASPCLAKPIRKLEDK